MRVYKNSIHSIDLDVLLFKERHCMCIKSTPTYKLKSILNAFVVSIYDSFGLICKKIEKTRKLMLLKIGRFVYRYPTVN